MNQKTQKPQKAPRFLGPNPGETLQKLWSRMSPLPGGKRLFSRLVGTMAPYTGTVGAQVEELRPGYARLHIDDRRRVRNHLGSIHAVALANLAEMTTGLAMSAGLPPASRGILASLSIEYLKKARGRITAECDTLCPPTNERKEYEVHGTLRDTAGDVVAKATARWLVGPASS